MSPRPVVLACGALASELRAVMAAQGLDDAAEVRYLPANLHNRPEGIVPLLEEHLATIDSDRTVLIAYADCGTGGLLDTMRDRVAADHPGIARLPGAHCYEVFAGADRFAQLHDEEPGTFYLTDFLAKHFDALVWQGLGLDRHPALLPQYFGNYRRVVLLSQSTDAAVVEAGRAAAQRLGLAFEHHHVGRGDLTDAVVLTLKKKVA